MGANVTIEQQFNVSSISRMIEKQMLLLKRELIQRLHYAGEEATNAARDMGSYTDRTTNLRSSTGYVVIDDGKIVSAGGFEAMAGPKGSGEEGSKMGRKLAEELAHNFQNGMALVVVAGMKYAVYVADKGFDVLDTAEQTAARVATTLLNDLKEIYDENR